MSSDSPRFRRAQDCVRSPAQSPNCNRSRGAVREDDQVRVLAALRVLRRTAPTVRHQGIHGALPSGTVPSGIGWAVDPEVGRRASDEWQGRLPVGARPNAQLPPSGGRLTGGDGFLDTREPGGGRLLVVFANQLATGADVLLAPAAEALPGLGALGTVNALGHAELVGPAERCL